MSKMRRLKRWMCILFVLAVIISGMCFEPIKTDTFFCYIEKVKCTKISYTPTVLKQNKNWCTGELLETFSGQGNSVCCVRYKPSGDFARVFVVDLKAFLLFRKKLYRKEVVRRYLCENVENSLQSIVCYIHHQDGAKV